MKLQPACVLLQNYPPPTHFSPRQLLSVNKHYGNHTGLIKRIPRFQVEFKSLLPSLRTGVVIRASKLNSSRKLGFRVDAINDSEPFSGKSGSVSFGGLSHQSVEESKLISTPFKENTGSFIWVLAPVALISSLVIPQFFIVNAIEDVIKNPVYAELITSLSTEVIFYAGLATFLLVTEHVQKPYLQFSSKRWSLITGLRGYLTSSFFTMGFKVIAPIFAVSVTWPVLGLPALVSVAPFLAGCLAQYAFERRLGWTGSSCWPLLPIIFEVYRIYQLTRATSFMEKLIYEMREATVTPALLDRTGALISMIVTFRMLGLVCLWSLLTFLLRLFPSRPVAENY
ncbi:hypothetical protein CDL12_11516 [Handroanthus impetiginosus]|uniref:Uncharacterized protein n=1 Tax=Handroanthus impetiginosus TaxID=429701 RepID=A0A2G9HEF5_9LAMI|nr:hypothetical protein CDL12_11516 [Handroanthus impetiginosus]